MEQVNLTVVIEMVKGPLTIPGSVPRAQKDGRSGRDLALLEYSLGCDSY